MKKFIITGLLLSSFVVFSQEHFSGFTTSTRVGLLNAGINPSELVNLKSRFEVQLFSVSINTNNNKVGFKDIVNGTNIEKKLFASNDPVNANFDAELQGPGFAMKALGWGFAIQAKSFVKGNVVDVDAKLGDALSNSGINSVFGSAALNVDKNQRLNATAWGEIGLSAAHKIFENDKHKISGGVTIKLLFPATYANIGVDKFQGTINNVAGNLSLTNASAGVNFAYSGTLANSFNNASDYGKSLFGGLNGFATDLGVNYVLKSTLSNYKLKIGASVRNIGSMTFKGDNNQSTNYQLKIQGAQSLNLNQFDGAESPKEIENKLLASGFLTKTEQKNDIVVKLPTVFNLYADLQIIPKLNITAFLQQKINSNSGNDQINAQNSFSLTPRFNIKFFEVFAPIGFQEFAGTTVGFGFRIGGFFLGSNSIITALTSDSKQADAYMGFRFGFL